jgi:hypothetical protein
MRLYGNASLHRCIDTMICRVISIQFPFHRVISDILPDCLQRFFVPNDFIVKARLPSKIMTIKMDALG